MLTCVEGISFAGLQAESDIFKAYSRTPMLRILVLDDFKTKGALFGFQQPRLAYVSWRFGLRVHSMLLGFRLSHMAMLSWQNAHGGSLPLALKTIESAAVLNISGNNKLKRLPANLKARIPPVIPDADTDAE